MKKSINPNPYPSKVNSIARLENTIDFDFLFKIFDEFGIGVCVTDSGYRIVKINQALLERFAHIFSFPEKMKDASYAVGKKCYHVLYDSAVPCTEFEKPCPLLKSIKSGSPIVIELDYNFTTVEQRSIPIKSSSGEVTHCLHLFTDKTQITEEVKIRELLEINITHPVLLIDNEFKMDRCNRVFHEIFNCEKTKVENRDFCEFIRQLDISKSDEIIRLVSRVLHEAEFESTYLNDIYLFESQKTLNMKVIPLRLSRFGVFLVFEDVTEINTLRRQVRRTSAISLTNQFTSSILHEISNPVGIILATSEYWLKKCNEQDGIYSEMKSIKEEAYRIREIISRVMGIIRSKETEFQKIQIKEVIAKMIDFIDTKASSQKVKIDFDFNRDSSYILGDLDMMKQVFLNLFINSMQAMPDGGIITIHGGLYNPRSIFVSVRDNGCGITDLQQKRIFDPFYTTKDKSTGLGLVVVKDIIEKHRGFIDVSSQGEKGTTFTLYFPKYDAKPCWEVKQCEDTRRSICKIYGTNKGWICWRYNCQKSGIYPLRQVCKMLVGEKQEEKILDIMIVDDEPSISTNISKFLANMDRKFEISSFDCGVDALLKIGRRPPDVVILDYKLPDIDGIQVCRELKLRPETKNIKIIVISAMTSPEMVDMFSKLGADHFFEKPLDLNELYNKIEELVE